MVPISYKTDLTSSNTKNPDVFVSDAYKEYINYGGDTCVTMSIVPKMYSIGGHREKIMMVVIHPFSSVNYIENTMHEFKENEHIFYCNTTQYDNNSGLVMVSYIDECEDETQMYVVSAEELKVCTVAVRYRDDLEHIVIVSLPYSVGIIRRGILNRFKSYETLFSTEKLNEPYIMPFVPLVGVLHEFLHVQESYVHEYFLNNIIEILNDAEEMTHSELPKDEKLELINETYAVLKKLRLSINDVSSYDYEQFKDVNQAIEHYYAMRLLADKEEAIRASELAEQERQKLIEKENTIKRKKEEYMKKISSKSELLDYFNLKFSEN